MFFDPTFGQRYLSLCCYIEQQTQYFMDKGVDFTRGYLEGTGRVWVFLARCGFPGTTKTTHIQCALDALEKLTKN